MKGPAAKAKDNLKYVKEKINNLPEDDKYKPILLDLYRATEALRHSNSLVSDKVYYMENNSLKLVRSK